MKLQHILKIALTIKLFLSTAILNSVSAHSAGSYLEGQVIITFKPSEDLEDAHRSAGRHSSELTRHFKWLSKHQRRVCGVITSKTKTTATLIAELRRDSSVEVVEPDYVRQACDMRPPNDADFQQLWALQNTGQSVSGTTGTAHDDIAFLAAWGMARAITNEVVVAVIDTGVDYNHPDLAANLWTNPGELFGNSVDDDANGYADDVHGYDFANGTGDPMDLGVHGTHIAGTIAAVGNNDLGVVGVDFRAHIMALRTSPDGDTLYDSAIIEAIQYASMMKQRGANIVAINASFGGADYSASMRTAIGAAGEVGIVFCAAAGNDGLDNDVTPFYPASYRLTNMIVVAASDQSDNRASFSNYGATSVDLAAPGANILSALPVAQAGTLAYVQGTSTTYAANGLSYSGTTTGISATIYNCGLGYSTDFPPAANGNIALIQRGTLFFTEKVANAAAAGARAAVIYNNVAGNFNGTLQYAGDWIPAISISQADGEALLAALPATGTVVNVPDPNQIYQYLDGTSMATPHVAGAVAFAAMNFPSETVAQRVQRILANATPVAGLESVVKTGGRLNLARIVDTDGNGLPDWWEHIYFGHLTGASATADPDHDGENNLAEWLCGTVPTDANSVLRLDISYARGTSAIRLQWPSVEGKYYRLLRTSNLLTGFTSIARTNILATPPTNYETGAVTKEALGQFYQLQLEP